jgi:hypothetical protein
MTQYNGPIAGAVKLAAHGGVMSVHRFGSDGDWSKARAEDAVLVAELVCTGQSPACLHCGDCASITTGLRDPATGIFRGVGITHSPGCPWLTAASR